MPAKLALLVATAAAGLALAVPAPGATPAGATLTIPKLGIYNVLIRYATTENQEQWLALGPIWWPGVTGRPGQGHVTAIAGHDVTHVPGFGGHGPFHYLNKLRRGDLIEIHWQGKLFRYRVTGSRYLPQNDLYAIEDKGHDALALSTCWPPYQSAHRLYVWALPSKH